MFLRNAWYVAAWSSEVAEQCLFTRAILGEAILFYRKRDRSVVALGNSCPHRFAPLSLGCLKGDLIECGYHGLQFDANGRCVSNPHGKGIVPPGARVRTYPVEERFGLIWIWMGTSTADASTIPDFQHLTDSSRATVAGVTRLNANYELATDNLMDLSHVRFVHKSFVESVGGSGGTQEITQRGNTIFSSLSYPAGKPSRLFSKGWTDEQRLVDHWFDIRWDAPALMRLDAGMTSTGQARSAGRQTFGSHLLTPESEVTTHYFYGNSRNFAVGDADMDEHFREWQRVGFGEEDKPMIEAVQRNMGTASMQDLRPALLQIDVAAVRARRVLASLIDNETRSQQVEAGEAIKAHRDIPLPPPSIRAEP